MLKQLLARLTGGEPAADASRWVVLDVESSGLDAEHDRLLAIAATAVQVVGADMPRVALADSFEVVLRQDERDTATPDKANILVHGIGVGAQRAGVPAGEALRAFVDYIGTAPLVAFHAHFDQTLIRRALKAQGLPPLANPWLDLAALAPVLWPDQRAHALDEWMALFGITCMQRHQAAADTLATAELLQALWPRVCRQIAAPDFRAVAQLAAQRRWLPP